MIGTIIGDIVGSRFEFNNYRSTDFDFFGEGCSYTDDTIMTVAVADAVMNNKPFSTTMREYGRKFPLPMGGYGGRFSAWLHAAAPHPYDSLGNGSAMRVSPCALLSNGNREWALSKAACSAMPTHNHPDGIKGALAITDAILMAFRHEDKETMRSYLTELYGYDLNFTCDDIRPLNMFNETCPVTVPQAIVAFLDSTGFEDAIRLAVSIGGDSDTIAAMTGGIAEAYYGIPSKIRSAALKMLPKQFVRTINEMYKLAQI
ncbi:MAG: ADP-ribosylglycohydrolase family protein [Bacteroidales bacterium]|nr:ADP-ribosylglycohydrolase family protein [Bacteroidales bacterium]